MRCRLRSFEDRPVRLKVSSLEVWSLRSNDDGHLTAVSESDRGKPVPGIKSLLCIDLTRHQFFNPTPPTTIGVGSESAVAQGSSSPKQPAGAFNLKNKQADGAVFLMERFQLPDPTFNFRAQAEPHGWQIDCFPLADRRSSAWTRLGAPSSSTQTYASW
jgi:hypothetical protein